MARSLGDGTPVHITIPTPNPWVPLRILGLGKQPDDLVQADVFLLTDDKPAMLPGEREGLSLAHDAAATDLLLDDLRSDDGMAWVPESAWLTKLSIDTTAGALQYDLAVDASGQGAPSARAAGLDLSAIDDAGGGVGAGVWFAIGAGLIALASIVAMQRRPARVSPW